MCVFDIAFISIYSRHNDEADGMFYIQHACSEKSLDRIGAKKSNWGTCQLILYYTMFT